MSEVLDQQAATIEELSRYDYGWRDADHAGESARRGLPRDACVDDPMREPFFAQTIREQRHPARSTRDSILGRQAVSEDQNYRSGGLGGSKVRG